MCQHPLAERAVLAHPPPARPPPLPPSLPLVVGTRVRFLILFAGDISVDFSAIRYKLQEVQSVVRAGGRLSQPKDCPVEMYQLMNWCWQKSAKKRPNFSQLVTELTKFATADGIEPIRVRLSIMPAIVFGFGLTETAGVWWTRQGSHSCSIT